MRNLLTNLFTLALTIAGVILLIMTPSRSQPRPVAHSSQHHRDEWNSAHSVLLLPNSQHPTDN